jgi:hypothetical protein
MKSNPFTELLNSGLNLEAESIKNIREIEEIDRQLEFLDNIKFGTNER